MKLLSLLKSKKRCLDRFLALSEDFLASARKGELNSLPDFHAQREVILKALTLYDRKLSECAATAENSLACRESPSLLQSIRVWNNDYHSLVIQISAVDHAIMEQLHAESVKIQEELTQARKKQAAVGKFKSGWVPDSGEGLDKQL